MQIRIRNTGAVVFDNEFRTYAQTQGAVFGTPLTEDFINQYGGDIVFEGPQATGGTVYQYSQRAGVEQLDGKWYTKYTLGPVFIDQVIDGITTTAAEQETTYKATKDAEQAKSVRQTRDTKLAETDWRFRSDMTPSQEWKDYCQALRDVPTQSGFPWTIVWPTQPE